MRTVALFSGGLDSTVMLYYLLAEPDPHEVVALSFDYGQRHRRELVAAEIIASIRQIPHRVVDVTGLKPILAAGALTGGEPVPHGHY